MAPDSNRIDQVLAGHFIIHIKSPPAHGPICFPLQFAMAARDLHLRAGTFLFIDDGARFFVALYYRHLQDEARFRTDG